MIPGALKMDKYHLYIFYQRHLREVLQLTWRSPSIPSAALGTSATQMRKHMLRVRVGRFVKAAQVHSSEKWAVCKCAHVCTCVHIRTE